MVAGFEHGGDVGAAVGFDGLALELGAFDFAADDVGGVQFMLGPRPERGEGDPGVGDGARFEAVLGFEVVEEFAHLVAGDGGEGGLGADVALEAFEGVGVVGDGVDGEITLFFEPVAFDGGLELHIRILLNG